MREKGAKVSEVGIGLGDTSARFRRYLAKVGDEEAVESAPKTRPDNDPDPDNGMWIVKPEFDDNKYRVMSVVHVDSIVHAAHLLPVFGGNVAVPMEVNFNNTLDIFGAFYLNKYIDYHAFETVF